MHKTYDEDVPYEGDFEEGGDLLFKKYYGEELGISHVDILFNYWLDYLYGDMFDPVFVLIGRKDFDKKSLRDSLSYQHVLEHLSQEAFLEYLQSGEPPGYYRGDLRIDEHPGLAFLQEVGFDFNWPPPQPTPSSGGSSDIAPNWAEKSFLAQLGYNVRKGTTREERQEKLKIAMSKYGLQKVADHICWLVSRPQGDHMVNAIRRWKEDLDWLYHEYYLPYYESQFRWPKY